MKSPIIPVLTLLLFIILLAANFYYSGYIDGRVAMRQQAIEHGYAYIITAPNGTQTFYWVTNGQAYPSQTR